MIVSIMRCLGLVSFGILILFSSVAGATSDSDLSLVNRFEQLSLDIRRHRSEMLYEIHQESRKQTTTLKLGETGQRVYLKWASSSGSIPKEMKVSLRNADGSEFDQSLELRSDPRWGLDWYVLLLPKILSPNVSLRVDVDYEVKEFQTPFQERRSLRRVSGSLPFVNQGNRPIYLRMDLEELSPFSRDRSGEAGLRLSVLNPERAEK